MMKNNESSAILKKMKNGLVVSCQVQKDDPIYTDDMVVKMAEAAQWGGAVGIRANTPEQIKSIKSRVNLPVIGLYKKWNNGTDVFITPTMKEVDEVCESGAEIVALDCTFQSINGRKACDLLPKVRKKYPDMLIFADVSNYEEAKNAVEQGADIVGPTLYGYTKETSSIEEPDFREFSRICRDFKDKVFIIMEGHIYTPEDAIKCLYLGADAVVVGSAITRPHLTTKRFTDLINGYKDNWRDFEKKSH
jgi:N-acylglucosamine-6-phosphate 2-epimerase